MYTYSIQSLLDKSHYYGHIHAHISTNGMCQRHLRPHHGLLSSPLLTPSVSAININNTNGHHSHKRRVPIADKLPLYHNNQHVQITCIITFYLTYYSKTCLQGTSQHPTENSIYKQCPFIAGSLTSGSSERTSPDHKVSSHRRQGLLYIYIQENMSGVSERCPFVAGSLTWWEARHRSEKMSPDHRLSSPRSVP